MDSIRELFAKLGVYAWNLPLIMLLVGTGLFFTWILWFIQARQFRHALAIIRGDYDDPEDEGDITHFQALCAALSATIGVGNIAGVATAIHYGGPGAVFWMWVTGFVGMATKYATCLLAQKYRQVHPDGSVSGGPMYYIEKGLGEQFKWLAILFAFCAVIASFGGGNMVQSNSMVDAFINYFGTPRLFPEKPLEELNDGRGVRETVGPDFRIITRSGLSFDVDIHRVKTLKELLDRINGHPQNRGKRILCFLRGDRIVFRDLTQGEGRFQFLPKTPVFAELGLEVQGEEILTRRLPEGLAALNKGRGLTNVEGADLYFRLRDGSIFSVDLEGVVTKEQLVERVNQHPANRLVLAYIHLDQKHLRLRDYTMGDRLLSVKPLSFTVQDLGIQIQGRRGWTRKKEGLSLETPIEEFLGGKKLREGKGPDFYFELHSGAKIFVDVEGVKTVGDLINRIESASQGHQLLLWIENGRIFFADTTKGKGRFAVHPYSPTLDDLWWRQYSASEQRPFLLQTVSPERYSWRVALGLAIAISVWLVIVGGIRRIGQVASRLVPFMCLFYVGGAIFILLRYLDEVPRAFGLIFYHAFVSTEAVEGGFLGATVTMTLTWGVKRAIFSNEAGLGSAPIAHAAAKTKEPVREGLVAMVGPFIDTILICTMTALVIIVTGQWSLGENGAALTQDAFTVGLPFFGIGGAIVAIGLILFAFSTSISWSYYGDRCVEYLFGRRAIMPYRWIFCIFLFIGAVSKLQFVWDFADVTMAAMAFPNLIATIALSGVVLAMTKDYFQREHLPYWEKKEKRRPRQRRSSRRSQGRRREK